MGCLAWSYQLLFLYFFLFHSQTFATLCPHHQSFALLQFKQLFSFKFKNTSSLLCDEPYPKMTSWKEDDDCCSWHGVTCNRVTGHVIDLDLSCSWLYGNIPPNSSLFFFPQLQRLNLAFNDFNLSRISPYFGQLISLTHLNLSISKFIGPIPAEISHLSNLVSLDISSSYSFPIRNNVYMFEDVPMSIERHVFERLVQNLTVLKNLDLLFVDLSTIIPNSLMNLSSSLTYLHLSYCNLQGNFPTHILCLPNLQILLLRGNFNLTGNFPKFNWSSPLKSLEVSDMSFSEQLPNSISNLLSLRELSLDNCTLVGSIPTSLGNLTQLSLLSLRYNKFSGQIPSFLSNFVQLRFLDLSENYFIGQLPNFFVNITHLHILELSSNQLSGPIPSHGNDLQNVTDVFLNNNHLNGTIPSWLFTLPLLEILDLSDNQLTGHIHQFQSKSLIEWLCLENNRFNGFIPSSIFELVNLETLFLSSNDFIGNVELHLFSKLKSLWQLDLSYNSLSINFAFKANSSFPQLQTLILSGCNLSEFPSKTKLKGNWPFPQLYNLALSGCNLSEFPSILRSVNQLWRLDLSNNKISSPIPNWMWDIGKDTLSYLNLSHNYLTTIEQLPWKNLDTLDLHSNMLQRSLPIPPPSLEILLLSNNKFIGEIPHLICNLSVIQILDLSNNSLGGNIPKCMGNFSSLHVLDLRKNKLNGTIPGSFAKGSLLRTLNFNENELEGPIPRSLVNCTMLEVLDVSNNKVIDTFPYWLQSLPKLQVLILHSNKFYGSLWGCSETKRCFPKLKVFDLSNNKFRGPLPAWYFKNLQAMRDVSESDRKLEYIGETYYQDSIVVTLKGYEIELEKVISIFTTIDFSNNNFHGEIPEVIGKLHALHLLNFSHNNLSGRIPLSFENLTALESLDISFNQLSGEIPNQLISLSFLSLLNLSYNQLTGPIPRGNQFDTFQNDSYIGNPGLCGPPLSKKCTNDELQSPIPSIFQDEGNDLSWFDWKISLMGYGSGLVLGVSTGYIVFTTRRPQWFVRIVERLQARMLRRLNRKYRGRRI
ncbi:receptor-like protein 34 [Mangifera indica]|uniref:receptor-like protein 34 n=1 Tax=Mangifera indica TaxID=29780 RepID=UPI001CFB2CF5|nr:receptor-like protein 34 [Mangifera indica]XP_044494424.1 receptor-like protein 34 [Mangifera indica]